MNFSIPREITHQEIAAYHRDGVILLRNMFDADWIDLHDHFLVYGISGGIGYLSALIVVAIRRKTSQVKNKGPLVSYPSTPYIPPTERDDATTQTQPFESRIS